MVFNRRGDIYLKYRTQEIWWYLINTDPLLKTEEKEILLLIVIIKCMFLKVGFTRFGKIGFEVW